MRNPKEPDSFHAQFPYIHRRHRLDPTEGQLLKRCSAYHHRITTAISTTWQSSWSVRRLNPPFIRSPKPSLLDRFRCACGRPEFISGTSLPPRSSQQTSETNVEHQLESRGTPSGETVPLSEPTRSLRSSRCGLPPVALQPLLKPNGD